MIHKVQRGVLNFSNEYGAKINQQIEKDFNMYVRDIEGTSYIDLKDRLCDTKGCLIFNKNGGLYNNGGHLSYFGAQLFLDDFNKLLK